MVAQERWSLTRGGCKGRFDCMSQVIFWLCFRVNADVTSSSAMNSLQAVKQETLSIAQSCQMSAVKSTEDNR